MSKEDIIEKASTEAVKFIDNMNPNELGIFTLRKAFEMGYIHGGFQTLDAEKEENESV